LPDGLASLDVGCGNGAFTETLIARSAPSEVVGIDPSEGQLAYLLEPQADNVALINPKSTSFVGVVAGKIPHDNACQH